MVDTFFENENDVDENKAWGKFLNWEEKSRAVLVVKKEYIDLVQDLNAGILLSQIVYWLLPSKKTHTDTKLRISKNGELWLAKTRFEWWDEIRLSEYQYDKAIGILKNLGFVETKVFKFKGDPTTHIKVNKTALLKKLDEDKSQVADNSGYQEKPNNEIGEIGISNSDKKVFHTTETTTETTINSRELNSSNCFSENQKTDEEFNPPSNNEQNNNNEQNKVNISDTPPSKAQQLRQMANEFKSKPKTKFPRKVYEQCPDIYQPYLDVFSELTGRQFRGFTKAYHDSWNNIKLAVQGKLFSDRNTPSVDSKYYGYTINLDTWTMAVKNFATRRNNPDYFPKNKTPIKNITPSTFLYNAQSPAQEKSYFITCLESKPGSLSNVAQIKDKTPELTDKLILILKQRLDLDLGNGDRNIAIQCSNKLSNFFETRKSKILLYDAHYSMWSNKINFLVDMLDNNLSKGIKFQKQYLVNDLTYTKFLPEYLQHVGSLPTVYR